MPQNLAELKANIQKEFKNISREMLKSVFENFIKRLDLKNDFDGGHIEDK